MKPVLCLSFLLAGSLFAHSTPAPQHAPSPPSQAPAPSPSPSSPAGHWEGAVGLPTTQLEVRVDLEENAPGVWSGSIDIPVQALRGYKLADVSVRNSEVSFVMPLIPGNPRFQGQLAADGASIKGRFTQATLDAPFTLARKPKPADKNQTPARGLPGRGLAGVWQGSLLVRGVMELRLVLHLEAAGDGSLTGTMDSIDQGARDIPVSAMVENQRAVRIEVQKVRGEFDGHMSDDGSEMAGEWKQMGQTTPLVLRRLAQAPDTRRPQDPEKPYPYEEVTVAFDNPDARITLAGTLTLPRSSGRPPAAILLSGSGPQDRDEAVMGHRPFLVLADHLTRHGVAVLRFDDRGVGHSTGRFAEATHEDFVSDALAALTFLRARPDIDPKRIGFIGHSEGGLIAPLAAVRAPDTAFLVLLAGVGVPVDQLLARQSQDILRLSGASQDLMEESARRQRELFNLLRQKTADEEVRRHLRELAQTQLEGLTDEQKRALGITDAAIEAQIRLVLSPWFRQLLFHDPQATLAQVRCPVLALNGAKDVQVAADDNLKAIREALARGGNRKVVTREFPDLNHLFQHCQTGAVAEYGALEETLAPEVLEAVSDWLAQTLRP